MLFRSDAGIIWGIRLPRVLAAAILGGALSVSGFLLQTFFANPIAGPFVLGISSGAKLTVSLVMIFLLSRGGTAGSMALIAALSPRRSPSKNRMCIFLLPAELSQEPANPPRHPVIRQARWLSSR